MLRFLENTHLLQESYSCNYKYCYYDAPCNNSHEMVKMYDTVGLYKNNGFTVFYNHHYFYKKESLPNTYYMLIVDCFGFTQFTS